LGCPAVRAKGGGMASKGLVFHKGRRKGTLLYAFRWMSFLPVASRVPMYSKLIWTLVKDPRVPASRKAIIVAAAGYVLVGRNPFSDEIPVLGQIDDVIVVVLAVEFFFDGIPEDILAEKIAELGIDREAFERDLDQVRRVTPAPVRKIVSRLPGVLEATSRLVKESGIGLKAKTWVTDARPSRLS
jgi:uncharacterized membrane protein YkvA (DUF1232 family)